MTGKEPERGSFFRFTCDRLCGPMRSARGFLSMRRALAAAVFAVFAVAVAYASPIFGPGPAKGEAEGVSILPIWLS